MLLATDNLPGAMPLYDAPEESEEVLTWDWTLGRWVDARMRRGDGELSGHCAGVMGVSR